MIDRKKITPPIAKIVPKRINIHNEEIIDNYHWLRDKSNEEVINYLESENDYTEKMMEHTRKLQKNLYEEIKGRIKENDLSAPEKSGKYYYYLRTEKDKQYPIIFRKKTMQDTSEDILLELNELAIGYDFFQLGVFRISPNHNLLAYTIDTKGSETYTLYIRDLRTGNLLEDKIENVSYGLEWSNDNNSLYYTVWDEKKRPYRVYKHVISADPEEDELVYQEDDESFFMGLVKTRDQSYLILKLTSHSTSENHFMQADGSGTSFIVIQPRKQGMEYYVTNHNGKFIIKTNDNAVNFKLMEAPIDSPTINNWKEIIPHRSSVMLSRIDIFESFLVITERKNGLFNIRVINLKTEEDYYIDFPEPIYTCGIEPNMAPPEYSTNLLRFNYTSLTTPPTIYEYNMDTRKKKLLKQAEILGGFKTANYTSERVFVKSHDGTDVPISLVYKKGMVKDGSNPLILYGYGAYGASLEPAFSSYRVSLLDRGIIFALAHVRGGGDMGREWYEQGKLLNKNNTFLDFIACAEQLITEKYTSSNKLVIMGGSAGGLLMGTVTNMRPELFKIVVAEAPFVDLLNTMLDSSLPLTVIEYEEWGNPENKEYYDYMKTYSPYDNVKAKDYPNMLILGGIKDPRVQYWEPAKLTAKLRALKTDKNILLLKTNMGTGHFGESGRYSHIEEIAFNYAFIIDILGIYSPIK
ncbi:MAG: S9 family peptidase [Candidatus Hodarchaeales archaeon]